ncbi:LytTR family DNA-binding domain-containing protein [Phenylobacterium sp. J367]|uniref:LytTR family DNA-binding domain-containing protein n=1 Tax=Phenylobacterium sp. J367 TaxID=2898435 RepID=UPI002150A26A|nr:LytTR family DNA-binding domain-containing protein [Phenylobacterium sp. J367]MCR5878246.1 LytTR family transcriptional regulator DNA-binding domain-containing protein [Phenylobacterium sp. J367]
MTQVLRERPGAAVDASWTKTRIIGLLRGTLVPALIVGSFMSFLSAFETSGTPFVIRSILMISFAWIASLMGAAAFMFVEQAAWVRRAWWRVALASAILMFAPMGLVVWSGVNLVAPPQGDPPVSSIPGYIGTSLVTSLFFCFLVAWIRRTSIREGEAATAAPPPPKFLERLPLRLRGADVWAVEAEDHYLRIHSSKGQDLILMRLADAVAELDGVEGMQVHRSWWVARDAIADAKRGDGRATLTLKDGAQVPVSRTYAGELREKGWI